MRRARIDRQTTETQIVLTLNLDGRGRYQVATGIRFFDLDTKQSSLEDIFVSLVHAP